MGRTIADEYERLAEHFAVVGSREYPNMELVEEIVSGLPEWVTVISGGADGVDSVAEDTAKLWLDPDPIIIPVTKAEWKKYGKRAGYLRNRKIAELLDEHNGFCIAFWDLKSPGTKMMLDLCVEFGIPFHCYGPRGKQYYE